MKNKKQYSPHDLRYKCAIVFWRYTKILCEKTQTIINVIIDQIILWICIFQWICLCFMQNWMIH